MSRINTNKNTRVITGPTASGKTLMAIGLAVSEAAELKDVLYIGDYVPSYKMPRIQFVNPKDSLTMNSINLNFFSLIILDEVHLDKCNDINEFKLSLHDLNNNVSIVIVAQRLNSLGVELKIAD